MVFRRRRATRRDAVEVTEPATLAIVSTRATDVVALLNAGELPDPNYRLAIDAVRSEESRARTLAVGGATRHADHSIVAAHLAASGVASGLRVVLIDGALQGSRLAPLFERQDTPGLTDVLANRAALGDALKPPVEGRDLLLLPAGQPATNPDQLLGQRSLATLVTHLAMAADMIIVDTAPANLHGWAKLLDGSLLVVPERAQAETTALTDTFVFGLIRTHDRSPVAGDTTATHPDEIAAQTLPAEPGSTAVPVADSDLEVPSGNSEPGPPGEDEPTPTAAEQDEEPTPIPTATRVHPGPTFDGPAIPTAVRTVGEIMADLAARRREQDLSVGSSAGASNWRSPHRDRRHRTGAPLKTPRAGSSDGPPAAASTERQGMPGLEEVEVELFARETEAPAVEPSTPAATSPDLGHGDGEAAANDPPPVPAPRPPVPALRPPVPADDVTHDDDVPEDEMPEDHVGDDEAPDDEVTEDHVDDDEAPDDEPAPPPPVPTGDAPDQEVVVDDFDPDTASEILFRTDDGA